jgi:osmotically-inducible protein OsmY
MPLVLLLALAGCKMTVETDPEAVRQAQQAGEVAKEAATQAGQKAAEGVKSAADQAGKATQQGLNTAAIRTALLNRKDINSKDVDIDTVQGTIYLRGSVPTYPEKGKVEEVVKAVAGPDYTVVNELKVGRQP